MKRRGYAPAYDKLATVLREERVQAGLTQVSLAEKLGKPQSFIAKYEAGERQLDVIEFLLVARAMSVPASRILRAIEPLLA
jgi:transcriptional regulator with XRE-family HTH domain